MRLRDVARAIGVLRETLPRVTRPLQELRIVGDGRRVVVRSDAGSFEPLTGQMVLDFEVQSLRDDVVRFLRPETGSARARAAFELYVEASGLDDNRGYGGLKPRQEKPIISKTTGRLPDPHDPSLNRQPVLAEEPDRLGKTYMLDFKDSLRERILVIALKDRHAPLHNNRPPH